MRWKDLPGLVKGSAVIAVIILGGMALNRCDNWYATGRHLPEWRAIYANAYAEGWRDECNSLMTTYSLTGEMYYRGTPYNVAWCESLRPLGDAEADTSVVQSWERVEWVRSDGLKDGSRDAFNAVFDRVPELCKGSDCIDRYTWEKYDSAPEYPLAE